MKRLAYHLAKLGVLARESLDDIAEFAFLTANNGGEQHDTGSRRQGENLVNDIAGGLGNDGDAGFGTVGLADMGIEQAEIIVNFGGGRDDRARAGAGAALLDSNGWRQALDKINVGFLHLVEELPRVGGERFDILALAFGVNSIEGER